MSNEEIGCNKKKLCVFLPCLRQNIISGTQVKWICGINIANFQYFHFDIFDFVS